jgi:hypothetical protein
MFWRSRAWLSDTTLRWTPPEPRSGSVRRGARLHGDGERQFVYSLIVRIADIEEARTRLRANRSSGR